MTDREKVIKALECCSSIDDREACPADCPYCADYSCEGSFKLMQDALELLKAQRPVTLADMLIIRARMFMDEKDIAWITRRIEKQIQNGDKVLILPDYMEPVIVPKDTEVHIETEPIGVFPGRINPSLSVNPPRIPPKRG